MLNGDSLPTHTLETSWRNGVDSAQVSVAVNVGGAINREVRWSTVRCGGQQLGVAWRSTNRRGVQQLDVMINTSVWWPRQSTDAKGQGGGEQLPQKALQRPSEWGAYGGQRDAVTGAEGSNCLPPARDT